MKDFSKEISQIRAIQIIETVNQRIEAKPLIKIVASKKDLKEGDIELILDLLEGQNKFDWSLKIVE